MEKFPVIEDKTTQIKFDPEICNIRDLEKYINPKLKIFFTVYEKFKHDERFFKEFKDDCFKRGDNIYVKNYEYCFIGSVKDFFEKHCEKHKDIFGFTIQSVYFFSEVNNIWVTVEL